MHPRVPLLTCSVTLACVASLFAPSAIVSQFSYDRIAIFSGEIWRLWTAHFVHYSEQHAFTDVAVFFLLGSIVEAEIGARRLAWALAVGMPLISLGLILTAPNLLHYRGASGIDVLLAIHAAALLWRRGANRVPITILAIGLAIKTACEAMGFSLDFSALPPGVQVAWQAHLFGAASGCLLIRMLPQVTAKIK